MTLARTRFHLEADTLNYDERVRPGAAVVLGDPDELKAAVWNLLDNAVKYSPAGLNIRVALEEVDNERVAVRVRAPVVGRARLVERRSLALGTPVTASDQSVVVGRK